MDTKVLTVRQPWAWAIIHAGKDVENRSQPTKHRGELYIHAGLVLERQSVEIVERLSGLQVPDGVVRGAIIGKIRLVDVVRDSRSPWAEPDQFHWVLADPQPMEPIPAKGRLGLWNLPRL